MDNREATVEMEAAGTVEMEAVGTGVMAEVVAEETGDTLATALTVAMEEAKAAVGVAVMLDTDRVQTEEATAVAVMAEALVTVRTVVDTMAIDTC